MDNSFPITAPANSNFSFSTTTIQLYAIAYSCIVSKSAHDKHVSMTKKNKSGYIIGPIFV